MIFILLIPCLCLVTADNTTDYIHQLEQKISDLESHTQASEQKQAAVLASILSKLQAQEEKIHQLTDDLKNTTTNSNSTTSTTGGTLVAFEASTSLDLNPPHVLVHFQKVSCNDGGGYNATTGKFIAPTTGTYQFWFSASVYMTGYKQSSDIIVLHVKGNLLGGFPSLANAIQTTVYTHQKLYPIMVQGQHIVSLKAGEVVYVGLKSTVNRVKAGSTFGGMLLR